MDDQVKNDAAKAAEHELLLEFESFNETTAWELGSRLRAAADAGGHAVFIDIWMGDRCVFRSAMRGTSPANADWARRKRNLVNLLHMSSYRIGLADAEGSNTLALLALDPRDHAPHGGCFPIRVMGTGVVGSVTVSGLAQREDHKLVVETIANYLGVDLGESRF